MTVAPKLQIKPGDAVAVRNAPAGVELELPDESRAREASTADAVLVFARNQAELAEQTGPLVNAAQPDALAWVAYPRRATPVSPLRKIRG